MPRSTPFSALARAVAQGTRPTDLLRELHREVLAATGGSSSVMLQRSRSGAYLATSGGGLEDLGGIWLRAGEAGGWETLAGDIASVIEFPPCVLRQRLNATSGLIVSIPGAASGAYLIVADPRIPEREIVEIGTRARVEFGLARELARLGRAAALHRRIQEVLLQFSRGVSATLSLAGAFEQLVQETNLLFSARRTSVWLHDRRARELLLAAESSASSEGNASAAPMRVAATGGTVAARGLRLERPQMLMEDGEPVLVAPLRGWRRALGTVVIEADAAEMDEEQFIDAALDLASQLSVAFENIQLLEEVLQQRRLLEDTFNSLIDLVVVADNALRVVQVNDVFAQRMGLGRRALLERPLAEFIGPEMTQWVAAPQGARTAGAAGEASTTERTRQFEDTRLGGIFSATVTPLINQEGEPVGRVLVARDITEQTRLEREREGLRQRLGQSEKLASLGQFVAGIAHEMNNPLQSVLGHLELLIETSEAAKPIRPTLRRIYQEGDRAAKIVRNLLVFSGARRLVRHRLRVDRVLSRALTSRQASLKGHGIQVSRRQDEHIPHIGGDALLLQQALLNILINAEHAIAATGGPGRIDITVAPSGDGQSVVLTITDNGHGIPSDVLPRIFDPFFTTKDVGQGTGLGLAITYGIIHEHGGTIQAANLPEGGASFTLEFPAQGSTRPFKEV